MLGREIVALTELERQHAILAGALDQRRIAVVENAAPALPAVRLTTSRSPRRTMTSVRSGESAGRSAIASRWPWPFTLRDLDQDPFVDDGRAAQQRPRDRNFILMGELPDQRARRVDEQRQPLGELGARGEFGMRDEAGQDTVEQIDMIGAETGRTLQEQLADPARGIGAAFGIAASDDFVKPGISAVAGVMKLSKPARIGWFFGQSRRPW